MADHLDLHLVAAPCEGHLGVMSPGVLADVRQRLLHDPIERQLSTWPQLSRYPGGPQGHVEPVVTGRLNQAWQVRQAGLG